VTRCEGARKVVVFDRDGTLVIDRGYLGDPDGLQFAPGAPEALRWLRDHGYRMVVITNQSGVGRGFFGLERLRAMNERLADMVEQAGARLDGIYACPHSPNDGCTCRKPEIGLLLQAASDLHFDPADSIVIGDKVSDIEFGRRAGAITILIAGHGNGAGAQPDMVAPDLVEAARAVTARRG